MSSTPSLKYLLQHSYQFDYKIVLKTLGVDLKTGLNSNQVAQLQSKFGLNEIEDDDDDPLWMQYLDQFSDPLIIMLLVSAVISLLLQQYDDAFSIFLAVIIVSTVAFIQEYKSEQAVEALKSFVQHKCTVVRNGEHTVLPIEQLVPGDIVVLKVGDRVPADLRVCECSHLRASEAILTGESKSRSKTNQLVSISNAERESQVDEIEDLNEADESLQQVFRDLISEQKNLVFMGTEIAGGTCKAVVVATGAHTQFTKIAKALREQKKMPTPLQESMQQLGKQLSLISFGIIGIIFVIGAWKGHPWVTMFNVSISLAVAAIPEGLPIVVTVTLALGVARMAKKKAIVRRLSAVEALGATSVCCVDKTGTLTCNAMNVRKLWIPQNSILGSIYSITGSKYETNGDFYLGSEVISSNKKTNPLSNPQLKSFATTAALCNEAQLLSTNSATKLIGQPTEGALLAMAFKAGIPSNIRETTTYLKKYPFNSVQKWMGVKTAPGNSSFDSPIWHVKGSLEWILAHSSKVLLPSGVAPLSKDMKQSIITASNTLARDALRIVALAFSDLPDLKTGSSIEETEETEESEESARLDTVPGNALTFIGLAGIIDPPREDIQHSIQLALSAKIQIVMITGDGKDTACAIASQLGFFDPESDRAMDALTVKKLHLQEKLHEFEMESLRVVYRASPFDKQAIVDAFQRRGHVVAMTGDGVNDALSLKNADVGIAMGNASDVTKEVSEMILVDSNFATIMDAVEEGKTIFNNIGNFLSFQLATSIAALTIVATSTLFELPLPLSTSMILFINIIMDGFPAQSLGIEPVESSIMKKPPRKRSASVLTNKLLFRVFLNAMIMVVGTLYVFNQQLTHFGTIHPTSDKIEADSDENDDIILDVGIADDRHALTMAFATFVMFQMFNAYNCRHHTRSVFSIGLTSNLTLLISLVGSIIGLVSIVYLPQLQFIFRTSALSVLDWYSVLVVSSSVLIFTEFCKFFGLFTGE